MVMKIIHIEDIKKFLEKLDIPVENIDPNKSGFSRTLLFKIYKTEYRIIWFMNEASLLLGSQGQRTACVPFRFIRLNTTYPLFGGNRSIELAYEENQSYSCFKIPLELKEEKYEK